MASKSKSRRRVFRASCILAALIVAGSSFAWFTSKDEVTNRLSAAANYGVTIAEDYQPPEQWLPGQKINKDVGAVNTGNVDAFVRMWLGGQMRLLKEDATPSVDATTDLSTTFKEVDDATKRELGLTYYKDGTLKYYKELSQEKINNPNDTEGHSSAATTEENNQPARYSDVQAVQAGGVLVYAPAGAEYYWTLEQASELPVYTPASGGDPSNTVMTNLPKGTIVGSSVTSQTLDSTPAAVTKLAPAVESGTGADSNYYGNIDASTFKPKSSGLYIFRRNIGDTADGTANTYEYSGYYYDETLDKYFALHTDAGANGKSDYVLPAGVIDDNSDADPTKDQVLPVKIATGQNVYLFTATETVIETGTGDTNLKWAYDDSTSGSEKFTVTYLGANVDPAATADDIVININLANIGVGSEAWTAFGNKSHLETFYYNNDVEEGDTTTKLVDSVELSKDTQKEAYLAFDFDLDVFMESAQVTMDENGKELATAVNPWSATMSGLAAINTAAKPTGGDNASTYTPADGNEISVVGWTTV